MNDHPGLPPPLAVPFVHDLEVGVVDVALQRHRPIVLLAVLPGMKLLMVPVIGLVNQVWRNIVIWRFGLSEGTPSRLAFAVKWPAVAGLDHAAASTVRTLWT